MGKTTFIRTLLQNLGVDRPIPSPTFSIIQAYEPAYFPSLPWSVLHADLYRIKEVEEVFELDILNPYQKVTFIEWPERLGPLLPQKNISLYFHSAPIGRTVTLIEN